MTRSALLAAMLFVTAPVLASAQQASPTRDEPVVVASGEAVVNAVPDRAWISIAAESPANSPREAQKKNSEAMNPVLDKLRAAGLPADAIRTAGYDLQQEFDFVNNRRVSRGYVAHNTVEVRVDDVARVGELLELAVGSGATSVGGLRFDLKDRGKLEREALRLATADARARAEAAASGASRTLDRVVRIEAQNVSGPPIVMARMAMAKEALQADAPPPISVGQMEIRAQVTLTASLK
jgi:uncharacterized protein YggE